MFLRRLTLPPHPFLPLGPRGTGKTTWLRRHLPQVQWYNLLLDRELRRAKLGLARVSGHSSADTPSHPVGLRFMSALVPRLRQILLHP